MASLYDYYIIDLKATRELGEVWFWAPGFHLTRCPKLALVITEEFVSGNTAEYDNGTNSQAILCSTVDSHVGPLTDLLKHTEGEHA